MKKERKESFIKVNDSWLKLIKETNINYGELILLCKIDTLSNNKDKCCTASNGYFADLLYTTERNIQKYLNKLKDNDLIKTYEIRKGMKTTSRMIYVQYKKINQLLTESDNEEITNIAHEQLDVCSDEPHEQSGNSTRTIRSEHTNDWVKPHEQMDTPIKDEKRIKENIKENGSGEPTSAYAEEPDEGKNNKVQKSKKQTISEKQLGNNEHTTEFDLVLTDEIDSITIDSINTDCIHPDCINDEDNIYISNYVKNDSIKVNQEQIDKLLELYTDKFDELGESEVLYSTIERVKTDCYFKFSDAISYLESFYDLLTNRDDYSF